MRQAQSLLSRIESVPRRELYFFALYRVLEAGILAALVFSPLGEMLGQPRHPDLGVGVAIAYLVLALVLFFVGRSVQWLVWIVFFSVAADIVVANTGTLALNVGGGGQFTTGNVTTLLTNLGGANGTSTTGFAAGSSIGFDTTNAAGNTFTIADNIADSSSAGQ